jgi:sec-independent protein translocase protein TatA
MGLHWYDLLGLVVLGLIIFGPKRLPEMGSSLGKTIREFQKSMREVTNPEPPTFVPPSATQAAPTITPAPAAPPALEATETTETTETAPVAVAASQPAAAAQIVEESAAPRVEEDSVR